MLRRLLLQSKLVYFIPYGARYLYFTVNGMGVKWRLLLDCVVDDS